MKVCYLLLFISCFVRDIKTVDNSLNNISFSTTFISDQNDYIKSSTEVIHFQSEYNTTDIVSDDYDYGEQECTADTVIEIFVNNVLPDDYEESKKLDYKRKLNHYNETIAILRRLHRYGESLKKKVDPILKRLMPRMTELLLLVDLPSDCLSSLARIGQSAKDREYWAIKCESINFKKILFLSFT